MPVVCDSRVNEALGHSVPRRGNGKQAEQGEASESHFRGKMKSHGIKKRGKKNYFKHDNRQMEGKRQIITTISVLDSSTRRKYSDEFKLGDRNPSERMKKISVSQHEIICRSAR